MSMDKSRTPNEAALDFVSKFNNIYFETFTHNLSSFVQDGFLKDLFEKKPLIMPPVDQTVIPENSRKKDKQKAHVTDDKQSTNQSTKAKPDVKTSAKNSQKGKKSSKLEATQILTGYEAVGEEQEQI
ncbi:hypothetical protein RhiirB3_453096 [Rhizophagus irregularis]|nr:hypothetical protein RhiirB3_453096 [Rhizophagus irregularis]